MYANSFTHDIGIDCETMRQVVGGIGDVTQYQRQNWSVPGINFDNYDPAESRLLSAIMNLGLLLCIETCSSFI